jgi:hypothetical protein
MCYLDCEIGVFSSYNALKMSLLSSGSALSDGLAVVEEALLHLFPVEYQKGKGKTHRKTGTAF